MTAFSLTISHPYRECLPPERKVRLFLSPLFFFYRRAQHYLSIFHAGTKTNVQLKHIHMPMRGEKVEGGERTTSNVGDEVALWHPAKYMTGAFAKTPFFSCCSFSDFQIVLSLISFQIDTIRASRCHFFRSLSMLLLHPSKTTERVSASSANIFPKAIYYNQMSEYHLFRWFMSLMCMCHWMKSEKRQPNEISISFCLI